MMNIENMLSYKLEIKKVTDDEQNFEGYGVCLLTGEEDEQPTMLVVPDMPSIVQALMQYGAFIIKYHMGYEPSKVVKPDNRIITLDQI